LPSAWMGGPMGEAGLAFGEFARVAV
jgi:hypothetical protein